MSSKALEQALQILSHAAYPAAATLQSWICAIPRFKLPHKDWFLRQINQLRIMLLLAAIGQVLPKTTKHLLRRARPDPLSSDRQARSANLRSNWSEIQVVARIVKYSPLPSAHSPGFTPHHRSPATATASGRTTRGRLRDLKHQSRRTSQQWRRRRRASTPNQARPSRPGHRRRSFR